MRTVVRKSPLDSKNLQAVNCARDVVEGKLLVFTSKSEVRMMEGNMVVVTEV